MLPRIVWLLALGAASPIAAQVDAGTMAVEELYGTYVRLPAQNGYHTGTISLKFRAGATTMLQWRNAANITWNLRPDLANGLLLTDATNPYQNRPNGQNFRLVMQGGQLVGFMFLGETYARQGAAPLIAQRPGGLHGYISAAIARPPATHAYGFSFYETIWPMLEHHLSGFQVGLAGTWIIPDNEDFNQPLLPAGAGTIREKAPERARTNWRDVFQTIEGGSGYWTNLHFPGSTPKYRINGTPDGYAVQISSPGWAWGTPVALERSRMGLAQLSNRLLLPPDGITYRDGTNGEVLGNAWMALPLTTARSGPAPVGDQNWTLFLNTANFKGPVACWIPDTWTRLSQRHPAIRGRGLDARPALMGGGAMEFNTVPFFENTGPGSVNYARVPRLRFPVDAQGNTYLLQDVIAYSRAALHDAVRTWLGGGAAATGKFNVAAAARPALTARPIQFRQGATEATLRAISGLSDVLQTAIFSTPGSSAFGLRWTPGGTPGVFPEYFEQAGNAMRVIAAKKIPPETKLPTLGFSTATNGPAYTSPANAADGWTARPPRAGPFTAMLTDGSVVTYSWYRFADQPALQALAWSENDREQLQAAVEKIHANWPALGEFMPPPSRGTLVSLDQAVIVTPPAGLEIGYVPIVTRQEAGNHSDGSRGRAAR